MKIVIFAPYFYPHKGGLEQYCWEVAARLVKNNHKITVVASLDGNEKEYEKIEGIEILRLATYNLLGGTFPLPKLNKKNSLILKRIFSQQVDWVMTNTRFFPLSLYGLWLAKKNKKKSVHIEHGTCHPKLKNPIASFIAWLYDQTLGRIVFKLADKYIAISHAAASFSQYLGARNVKVIYNSVDTKFFEVEKERLDDHSSIDIVYVGRLIEAKGVHDLIKAFCGIDNKNIKLIIIGTGNFEACLKELAGLDKRVKFLGQQDKNEIKNILSSASIFVNPSYSEGLPTSVLEAGASGLAVAATDVGGTREIIKDGLNGCLLKPKNMNELQLCLTSLIEDEKLRNNYGYSLRKTIESNFSWDKNIEILEEFLK